MDEPLTLEKHDAKSDARAESIKELIRWNHEKDYKEKDMSEGINTDKVIVNAGGAGDGGGGSMAAVIAALGNRNQGNDNAALIAALGNRNGGGYGDGMGFGGGAGGIWPIILLALLGGRRGGLGGGGDDCCDNDNGRIALIQSIMESVGDVRAQVPTTALETQNAIQSSVATLALGTQQGFANTKDAVQATSAIQLGAIGTVKDTVQNGFFLVNNNLQTGLCDVKATVRDDGDRTRAQIALYHEADLQRQLAVAQEALADERYRSRSKEVEVNVSQNVNQQQAQAQFQAGLVDLRHAVSCILQNHQETKQGIVNLGTMVASGTQSSANTNIK